MTTQQLVAAYAEGLKSRTGLNLPRSTATHLVKVITELKKDDIDDTAIMQGLTILLDKSLTPGALPGCVIEAAVQRPSRGSELCPICDLPFKTEQRLQEHLSDVHHVDVP